MPTRDRARLRGGSSLPLPPDDGSPGPAWHMVSKTVGGEARGGQSMREVTPVPRARMPSREARDGGRAIPHRASPGGRPSLAGRTRRPACRPGEVDRFGASAGGERGPVEPGVRRTAGHGGSAGVRLGPARPSRAPRGSGPPTGRAGAGPGGPPPAAPRPGWPPPRPSAPRPLPPAGATGGSGGAHPRDAPWASRSASRRGSPGSGAVTYAGAAARGAGKGGPLPRLPGVRLATRRPVPREGPEGNPCERRGDATRRPRAPDRCRRTPRSIRKGNGPGTRAAGAPWQAFLVAHRRASDPPGMKPGPLRRPVFFLGPAGTEGPGGGNTGRGLLRPYVVLRRGAAPPRFKRAGRF